MKILITGSNGFIATEIIDRLMKYKPHWILYPTTRNTLDIADTKAVDRFFDINKIDIVIHCAISGGYRNDSDTPHILYNNNLMFESLIRHRDKFKLMITFGSGAEADRGKEIMNYSETDFINSDVPSDYYGLSKYNIAKRVREINDNILNLRIFNVFGEYEAKDRMIRSNVNKYISGKTLEIYQNKYMDFFSVDDLYKVIDYFIENNKLPFVEMNVCYRKKYTLLDIADMINNLSDDKSKINVVEESMLPAYCGSADRLYSLGIEFYELEKSLKKVYLKWKN